MEETTNNVKREYDGSKMVISPEECRAVFEFAANTLKREHVLFKLDIINEFGIDPWQYLHSGWICYVSWASINDFGKEFARYFTVRPSNIVFIDKESHKKLLEFVFERCFFKLWGELPSEWYRSVCILTLEDIEDEFKDATWDVKLFADNCRRLDKTKWYNLLDFCLTKVKIMKVEGEINKNPKSECKDFLNSCYGTHTSIKFTEPPKKKSKYEIVREKLLEVADLLQEIQQ